MNNHWVSTMYDILKGKTKVSQWEDVRKCFSLALECTKHILK